jgi:predicted fused transcriptional regulator/phosphomethylpyrimidine kinase/predicted transcriptional regulator
MKFIEELVVEDFLPTVRSMLAEALRDRELTQREVADVLGISQSAVSKYAHGEVARNEQIAADDRVVDLVERIADGLATGDMSRVQALVEIEVLIRQLEDGDLLADLHEEVMPALVEADIDFSIHDPDSRIRTTEQVRSSVRRGLRTLTSMSGIATLIPNVGSNLVECLPDATTVDDVAGVPGRIFDIKGRATVPSDPEFGVSEHAASVLLAARNHVDVQAGLNITYDPDLIEAFEQAGYTTVEFDSEAREELESTIGEAVAKAELSETFVLYQTGGFGIEPISYVIGPDAPTVAAAVRSIN